jgi:membrane protein YdbS with pleckstrin-like domain
MGKLWVGFAFHKNDFVVKSKKVGKSRRPRFGGLVRATTWRDKASEFLTIQAEQLVKADTDGELRLAMVDVRELIKDVLGGYLSELDPDFDPRATEFPELVGLVQAKVPALLDQTAADELKRLNAIRNGVVHRGHIPRWEDVQAFVQLAIRLCQITLASPQPTPTPVEAPTATREEFPGQQPGEELAFPVMRRHWMKLLERNVLPLGFAFALVGFVLWNVFSRTDFMSATVVLGFLLLSLICGWMIFQLYDWGNDSFIVTNRRVIRIERVYFFFEERHEASLRQIQNVSIQVKNPVEQLFNFGDVLIETASRAGSIRFDGVPDPREVQVCIFQLIGHAQPRGERKERPPWLARLFPFGPLVEDDVVIWHKHWIILLRKTIAPGALLLVLPGVFAFLTRAKLVPLSFITLLVVTLLWLIDLLWFVWQYQDWRNDEYLVTPDRLIDIERIPFVLEDKKEASLNQIQDVRYEIPSLGARILGWGHVYIQTAGQARDFDFLYVPDPRAVQDEVTKRVAAFRAQQRMKEARDQFEEWHRLAHGD